MSKFLKLFIIFISISSPFLVGSCILYCISYERRDIEKYEQYYQISNGLASIGSIFLMASIVMLVIFLIRRKVEENRNSSISRGSSSSYSSYNNSSNSSSSSSSNESINLTNSDGSSNGLKISDGKITGVDGYGLHYYVDKENGRISGLNGDTKGYIREDGTVTDIDGWTKGRITSDGRFVDNSGNTQNDIDEFIENLNKY